MDETINIVITDDHPVVLQGLKNLIEADSLFAVIAQFTTGSALLSFLKDNTADVILLDITLPDGNGIHYCKQITKLYPDMVVLAISNLSERSIVRQMLKNGAKGYMLKTAEPKDILRCIQDALNGKTALSGEVRKIMEASELDSQLEIPELTKREKQILEMLSKGKKSAEIATELFISPLTVKTHRATLLQKFGTNNVVALINQAKDYGML